MVRDGPFLGQVMGPEREESEGLRGGALLSDPDGWAHGAWDTEKLVQEGAKALRGQSLEAGAFLSEKALGGRARAT